MYKRLKEVLHRTRTSLYTACFNLGIDAEELDPLKMLVISCDNCGFWDVPTNMVEDPDGTVYCSICDVANLYKIN